MPHFEADESLWHWANTTANAACDAACRINSGLRDRGTWWEGLDKAAEQVCWGCNEEPWPNERGYGHQIWHALHEAHLPIRAVAAHTNLWSVPCPRGLQRRDRGTRCLIGHFVYGIMCFFKWMGETSQENFALTNLESVIDLAPIVSIAPCKNDWAFSVAEVAENYERILSFVWHRHQPVPDFWLPASGALRCRRARAREAQEMERQSRNGRNTKIQCLVLTMYPQEIDRMAMIADTYGDDCNSLVFFTAGEAPSHFRGYRVVNLEALDVAADAASRPSAPNTIAKTFALFRFAGLSLASSKHSNSNEASNSVFCRLDSDTLFLPQNLQRILHCRNFSSSDLWAIGRSNYAHKHQQPGRVFLNGGTGICLSQAAVKLLAAQMESGKFRRSSSSSDWNTGDCVVAPGHWDDVVLTACLAKLGIPISRWDTDCEGRSLFWPDNLRYAFAGPAQVRPRRLPPRGSYFQPPSIDDGMLTRSRQPEVANYHFWLHRVWQYLACDAKIWLADFPVSFHPYRNRSEGRRHFGFFKRGAQIQGYRLQLWDGGDSCGNLLC